MRGPRAEGGRNERGNVRSNVSDTDCGILPELHMGWPAPMGRGDVSLGPGPLSLDRSLPKVVVADPTFFEVDSDTMRGTASAYSLLVGGDSCSSLNSFCSSRPKARRASSTRDHSQNVV
eukprot:3550233-Prymnesium_polylepis.1